MTLNNKTKERIYYLDIARGFAIFGMFTQHCMLVHEVSAGEGENLLGNLFLYLGTAPSAPVFMLIMGVFLMESSAGIKQTIWRGIKLLILGFLLNLLRFTLPLLIAILIVGSDGLNLSEGETLLTLLFSVDIFQLAGLSLIFCAFIKKTAEHKLFVPFLSFSILIVSPFLWGQFKALPFSNLFWGDASTVYFPFFPWVIYPLLGMYLSQYFIDINRVKKVLKRMSFYGFILGILGGLLLLLSDAGVSVLEIISPEGDYHRSGLSIHLLIISFIFVWFRVCYWLEQKIGIENKIIKVLVYWSRNVTAIYFIQWVLFGWSMLIFDSNKQNAFVAAMIGLAVLTITHFSVKSVRVRNLFSWV